MAVPGASAQAAAVRDHGFHPLRVARVVAETADASSFVLDVPPELRAPFAYEAGQFCTFRVVIDGEAHFRCYSMSSAPGVDADLQVTVKRVPGGRVSNWLLDHVVAGSEVEVTFPAGVFCLQPGEGDVVAFAAGSGITPVHSLLKAALASTGRRVHLLYANRDGASTIFAAELAALEATHPDRLVVAHHLDVDRGFVDDGTVRRFLDGVPGIDAAGTGDVDADVYVCGPTPFMDIVEGTVLAAGVPAARIHIERFAPASPVEVPDAVAAVAADAVAEAAASTTVTIDLDGRTAGAEHHPGTTILQMARQLGMAPPFSCESGSCATCMARLESGTCTMHVNNALTDDEVADGWILTCQAVPTSAAVHVVYEGA